MNPGTLKLQVFSPRVVRVAYSLSNTVPTNSLAVIASSTNAGWSVTARPTKFRSRRRQLQVRVDPRHRSGGFL